MYIQGHMNLQYIIKLVENIINIYEVNISELNFKWIKI